MDFEIRESLERADVEGIVIGIPEGLDPAAACDPHFASTALRLVESGDLPLKPLETLMIPGKQKIIFVGLSRTADAEAWRKAAATVLRRFKKVSTLAFSGGDPQAIVEGALIGSFSVESYKTTNNKQAAGRIVLVGADSKALEQGRMIGESINWARQLINEPSNRKPPRVIADRAREMASDAGLVTDVLDEKRIRELQMGALLGVSQGSDEPPRFVVLK